MKNKLISGILALCMLITIAPPISAAGFENTLIVTPRNTNIKYSTISLSVTDGTAYCSASVTGYSTNTSKVSIYLYLQKYKNGGWTTETSWSDSADSYTLTINKSSSVSRGRYRLKASYYAGSENIVKYSGEQVY